jgi:hypothetical protein
MCAVLWWWWWVQTAWTFDNETQGFTLTAYQNFAAGDAVCESYGKKDNVRFFVNYGFCVEGTLRCPALSCAAACSLPELS